MLNWVDILQELAISTGNTTSLFCALSKVIDDSS